MTNPFNFYKNTESYNKQSEGTILLYQVRFDAEISNGCFQK